MLKDKTKNQQNEKKEKYIYFTVIIHSAMSILNIGQTVGPFNFLNKVKHQKIQQK